MMEREGDPAPIWMCVKAVAPFLPLKSETIELEGGSESAGGNGPQEGIIDAHTVTATTGRSVTLTAGGKDSPSSRSSSITI